VEGRGLLFKKMEQFGYLQTVGDSAGDEDRVERGAEFASM
jgi:hypothetical protein